MGVTGFEEYTYDLAGRMHRANPPDAGNRMSGGVGGLAGPNPASRFDLRSVIGKFFNNEGLRRWNEVPLHGTAILCVSFSVSLLQSKEFFMR